MHISVGKGRETWYLGLFVVQSLLCLSFLIWYEIFDQANDGKVGTFLAIIQGMGPIVIAVAAETLVLIEGIEMLAERYLRRRYQEGREAERKELNEAWEAWLKRRDEAMANNQPFNEPPPSQLASK